MGKIVFPESYNCNLSCGNCGRASQLRIPLGITVLKYAESNVCPICGCMMGSKDSRYMPEKAIPMYLPYGFGGMRW